MPTPYEQEDDFDTLIKRLAGPAVEDDPYADDAAVEQALTMELGLNDAPERSPEAQRIIDESRGIVEGRRDGYGGRSPEAQRLIDQAKSIVGGKTSTFSEDPAAEFGALAEPAPEPAPADPYAGVKGKGYGPETAEQMAAPEAPIYTPKGPGQFRDAMSEGSDEQGRLGGVDPRFRQADEAVARLNAIRAGMQPPAQQQGPGKAERTFRNDMGSNNRDAQIAFALNWIAGGPQQAMAFQELYDKKRKAYLDGLKEARGQDTATARENQPISDAQAQTLVRVYGVTPEAAAKMTAREYAQLEPVLKSAPYAVNQQDSLRNKYSVEELRALLGLNKNQNELATSFGTAQLRGQNALATVKANKKGGGGGGGMGQPRDIVPVLAAQTKMTYDQASLAYQRMLSGVPAETPEQEEAMNAARILEQMPPDEFKKARVAASNQGVLGRTNTANRVDESIRGKTLDPGKRSAARVAFTNSMSQLGAAKRGFDLLSKTGKIDLLVKAPYGEWDRIIQANMSGEEQNAARAIAGFLNPAMRKQTGAAMSAFEKELSFTQFGISANASPFADPAALGGFLRQARDELMNVHDAVTREYGADALPKIKGR